MKRSEVTGSDYFNVEAIRESGDLTLVIEDVVEEEFKAEDGYKQKKVVLLFRNTRKKLSCGKEKLDKLFDLFGVDDTDDFIGQRIRLTLGRTKFQGKLVDCVDLAEPAAVRAPPARKPVAAPADDQADDDIPY